MWQEGVGSVGGLIVQETGNRMSLRSVTQGQFSRNQGDNKARSAICRQLQEERRHPSAWLQGQNVATASRLASSNSSLNAITKPQLNAPDKLLPAVGT